MGIYHALKNPSTPLSYSALLTYTPSNHSFFNTPMIGTRYTSKFKNEKSRGQRFKSIRIT